MMIKVFTKNKNNKIELTTDELKKLLDEAYWEGYRSNISSWTYSSPNLVNTPPYTITSNGSQATIATVSSDSNNKRLSEFINQKLNSSVGMCTSH